MRRLIPAAIMAAMFFALAGCGDTAAPAGPDNNPEPSSSCPEVIYGDTGPELKFLELRGGKLFVPEVDDSTYYDTIRYFDFPGTTREPIEYTGTRVVGGVEFPAPTKERSLLNVNCTDGGVAWSYVDSLSADGLDDFTTWQDPTTKKWAYQWLPPDEPQDDPFEGCDILPNSAEIDPDSGEWWAVSTVEGQILRVSEDGLWIPTGTPWTHVRFFGERGELPGVIETPIGPDGFVPRPADKRYHDLNLGYNCTDTSFVWSLIVDLTPVPEGVVVARHTSGKACFRVTLWIDGGDPFAGCEIFQGTAEFDSVTGEWQATSPDEAMITAADETGIWVTQGSWTHARIFGELGQLPSVIEVPIGPNGFVPRPADPRYHDLNLIYQCPSGGWIWSMIVDQTPVPAGVEVARHVSGKACYRVTAWIEDGEPEPGECEETPPGSGVGPRVSGHEKFRGAVAIDDGCYTVATWFGPVGSLEPAQFVEGEPNGVGKLVFPYAHLPLGLNRYNYVYGDPDDPDFWSLVDSMSGVEGIDAVEQEPGAWCYQVVRND